MEDFKYLTPPIQLALFGFAGAWTDAILQHYCQHVAAATGKHPDVVRGEVRAIYESIMDKHRERLAIEAIGPNLPDSEHPTTPDS